MWKTPELEWARCHLCPTCDSLGPHVTWDDEDADQSWLNCIDCGALLGRFTPLGLEPPDDEPWPASEALKGLSLWTRAC
jgi:hypothetical protein